MGPTVSVIARKLLLVGVHTFYPNVRSDLNPASRFSVCQCIAVSDEYIITDKDLRTHVRIHRDCLEDPSFDLVGWYIEYLSQRDLYEQENDRRPTCRECTGGHSFVGCSNAPMMPIPKVVDESSGLDDDDCPDLIPLSDDNDSDYGEDDDGEDYPDLIPLSDDSDGEDDEDETAWDLVQLAKQMSHQVLNEMEAARQRGDTSMSDAAVSGEYKFIVHPWTESAPTEWEKALMVRMAEVLTSCQPYPGDRKPVDPMYQEGDNRFVIRKHGPSALEIYDRVQGFETHISKSYLQWEAFSIGKWFAERSADNSSLPRPWEIAQEWISTRNREDTTMGLDFQAFEEVFDHLQ